MAKMIIEFTDLEGGRAVSMTNRVETEEAETESWAVIIGLAIKHLWRTHEIQKFADANKVALYKDAVAEAEAIAAKKAVAE